jgi:hypothetical protein
MGGYGSGSGQCQYNRGGKGNATYPKISNQTDPSVTCSAFVLLTACRTCPSIPVTVAHNLIYKVSLIGVVL